MENTNSVPFWYEELMFVILQVRNVEGKDYLYYYRDRAKGFIHGLYAADIITVHEFNLLNTVCDNAKDHAIKDISHAPL